MITHDIKHTFQPTNHTCSQTSLAMVLSFFGHDVTPKSLEAQIPVAQDDDGNEWGTINPHMATWCVNQGYKVALHTADFQIVDLSWKDLSDDLLLERLAAVREYRDVPALGKRGSKLYVDAYRDFIQAGGSLRIQAYMSTELLDMLLPQSPLLLCISFSTLYGRGRYVNTGLRRYKLDDINGKNYNHSVVLYGKDDDGNYLIADPYEPPGRHVIEPQRLLAAMTAAQMECDNFFFQLSK